MISNSRDILIIHCNTCKIDCIRNKTINLKKKQIHENQNAHLHNTKNENLYILNHKNK